MDDAEDSLDSLYRVIGSYCRNGNIRDAASLGLLERAILVPISKDKGQRALKAFALSFLTQPNLELFEANVAAFAAHVDVERVSAAIVEAYTTGWPSSQSSERRLWLLAHFIALGNGKQDTSLGSSYLNAMYIQLSSLHIELRRHHIGRGTTAAPNVSTDSLKRLPLFIEKAIGSLVARDEISHILEKFTM